MRDRVVAYKFDPTWWMTENKVWPVIVHVFPHRINILRDQKTADGPHTDTVPVQVGPRAQ